MVSTSVMNYLLEAGVLGFVFPLVVLMAWRLRTRKNLMPALAGAIAFFAFGKLFASVPFMLFVGIEHPLSEIIRSNEIIYAIYQGVVAALLEETGRYLVFSYFLTKHQESRQTAITYGIGHGGIECMFVLGWTNLQYYMSAIIIGSGEKVTENLPKEMIQDMTSMTVSNCVMNTISGILLYALQIVLSILVFQAFRNTVIRKRLFGYAVLFHAVFYLPQGLYQAKLVPQLVMVLLQLFIFAVAFILAFNIYKKMGENEKKKAKEQKKGVSASEEKGWAFANKKLSNIDENSTKNNSSSEKGTD